MVMKSIWDRLLENHLGWKSMSEMEMFPYSQMVPIAWMEKSGAAIYMDCLEIKTFARRGFNIHSLAVGTTEDPTLSRMTIVVNAASTPLEQITKQLHKLVNVIKGDMNVVGPRPEQPKIFADLRAQIPGYEYRQKTLPGITGWAQINHHYDTSVEDVRTKLSFDLEYVARRQSAGHDLEIMAKTLPVMVFKKGAM